MDFSHPVQQKVFFDIHTNLPRESPGSDHSTLQALKAVAQHLPDEPRIGDFGCGPGSSALPLAKALPQAHITAIDLHKPFIDDVAQRAQKKDLTNITAYVGDMTDPPFDAGDLDIIWCEGAIYNLGIDNALQLWQRYLSPQGIIVFNDAIWQAPASKRPPELIELWSEYPSMTDHEGVLRMIEAAGYETLDHFILPEADWWDSYYTPMEDKLATLEAQYANQPDAILPLQEARAEILMRRKYAGLYDYCFYCVRSRKN